MYKEIIKENKPNFSQDY